MRFSTLLLCEEKEKGGPANLPDKILNDKENELIGELLKSLNLTRKDTCFDKKWVKARYTMKRVAALMDDPLSAPQNTFEMGKALSEKRGDILALHALGLEFWEKSSKKIETPEKLPALPEKLLINEKGEALPQAAVWKKLPAELRDAVSILYDAIAKANAGVDRAFSNLTEDERLQLYVNAQKQLEESGEEKLLPKEDWEKFKLKQQEDFYKIADKVNWDDLAGAAGYLASASRDAEKVLLDWSAKQKTLEYSFGLPTPHGLIVLGGGGADIYAEDAAIQIDLGGDDVYRCRTASAFGKPGSGHSAAIAIDLSGNDVYISDNNFSQCAALMGCSLFIDCGGDDIYKAKSFSQTCALFGVALMAERGGNDEYRALDACQGAASFGLGICADAAGNDNFRASRYAQGFAGVAAVGILTDGGGNDLYYSGGETLHEPLFKDRYQSLSQGFSIGDRYGNASGGIGILHDVSGNDRYLGDIFAQGAGYWYALGLLMDEDGNDDYLSGQYCQGAGIHLAVGALLDLKGNDSYTTTLGLGLGSAHDLSVGLLIDKEGNDKYQGGSTQEGGALTNAVALFIDGKGDDLHASNGDIDRGGGRPARGFGSIGLFLDMSGKDVYTGKQKDDSLWTSGDFGAGADRESYPKEKEKK